MMRLQKDVHLHYRYIYLNLEFALVLKQSSPSHSKKYFFVTRRAISKALSIKISSGFTIKSNSPHQTIFFWEK